MSDYFDVQLTLCDKSFTFVLSMKYLDWNSNFSSNKIALKPSSYHQTQLIILYANQLRTKTLANLHSRALALMRELHIQMFTLSPYPPNYNTINVAHPPKSSLPEHYKDIGQSVYVFIKIFLAFSKCMNVFNLSEEAVNRCKALISASHDPPTPHQHTHTLPHLSLLTSYSQGTRRKKDREI